MSRFPGTALILILVLSVLVSLPAACSYSATLRVGALSTLDAMPLSLALYKPVFEENNLAVEAKYFESPAELRAALTEGQIDAAIMDLPGALLLKEVKIVRVALKAWSGRTHAIMVAPHISATAVQTLQNANIAVCSEASHRYVADQLLASAGVKGWTEVQTDSPDTTLRMLLDGKVNAALLPEPQVSLAIAHGAHVILDDADRDIAQTVVVFRKQTTDSQPAVIRRFLRAYEQSVRELNVRGENYRPLLTIIGIPAEVCASLPIPVFPFPGEVPGETDVTMVNDWLVRNKMLAQPVAYKQLVNAGFLGDHNHFHPAACCGW